MCRYHAGNCKQYVGQMVQVQTRDTYHRGVVDRITRNGLYLRPVGMASGVKENQFGTLDLTAPELQAEHIFYGGYRGFGGYGYGGYGYGFRNPAAFFVPFLTILALSSLLFW